jgi:hypothetical protein
VNIMRATAAVAIVSAASMLGVLAGLGLIGSKRPRSAPINSATDLESALVGIKLNLRSNDLAGRIIPKGPKIVEVVRTCPSCTLGPVLTVIPASGPALPRVLVVHNHADIAGVRLSGLGPSNFVLLDEHSSVFPSNVWDSGPVAITLDSDSVIQSVSSVTYTLMRRRMPIRQY